MDRGERENSQPAPQHLAGDGRGVPQSIESSGGTAESSRALLLTLALTTHSHVIESKILLLLELQFPRL